jgi:hypothetical protein
MNTAKRFRAMILTAVTAVLLLVLPLIASAQGRGRGWARGHDQSWKCGKFVNCHDARNGRWDGRGPYRTRFSRNGIFVARGSNVQYRNRYYNMNDYWRRRHLMRTRDFDNWRYRNRVWRNR